MSVIQLSPLVSTTTGFLVLFVGKRLNQELDVLRNYSIPEPVSGGLLVALLLTFLHIIGGPELNFSLESRDFLLVYFFTTVGMNARFSDLKRGGPALVILLGITVGLMTLQNVIGITMAGLLGMNPATGLLVGTVSLIGGHGTTIAWAPTFLDQFQIENAMEIGIAAATFGLVLASASGGPIAQFLIRRFRISCPDMWTQTDQPNHQSGPVEQSRGVDIDVTSFLAALLAINLCIITGTLLNTGIAAAGLKLPLFVPCLLVGILYSNLLPTERSERAVFHWPRQSPSLDLIGELSLGIFLAMSLMSLQLWTLVGLAPPLLFILVVQFAFALIINLLLVFG